MKEVLTMKLSWKIILPKENMDIFACLQRDDSNYLLKTAEEDFFCV